VTGEPKQTNVESLPAIGEVNRRGAMPDQRWFIHPSLKGEAQGLAQHTGLPPLLTQVLLNRGIDSAEAAPSLSAT
jgi:hypothetical protein